MKFGSKKFPEFSPPFPSSQEFLQSKYSQGRISEVHWITLPKFVSTKKLQRFNQIWSKLKSQYTAVITGSIQRGTKRRNTGSKHVHMIRKIGACYPDWIIKPMSAKGFVRYVTDNQWNWIINIAAFTNQGKSHVRFLFSETFYYTGDFWATSRSPGAIKISTDSWDHVLYDMILCVSRSGKFTVIYIAYIFERYVKSDIFVLILLVFDLLRYWRISKPPSRFQEL